MGEVTVKLRGKGESSLKIIGMHCATCSITVQRALMGVKGVVSVNVSLASNEANLIIDPEVLNYGDLKRAVRRVGYDVYSEEITVNLRLLEPDEIGLIRSILRIQGVFDVKVDLTSKAVIIEYNPLDTSPDALVSLIRGAGFEVISVGRSDHADIDIGTVRYELMDIVRRLIIATPLTISIILATFLGIPGGDVVSLALATPVQFYSGWRFISGAIRAFRNGTANMDTLVTLGTLSTYVFSLAVTLNLVKGYTYFEASAVIVTLVLLGKYLEVRMRIRAGDVVRRLSMLQPRTARVITGDGEVEVPVDQLSPGMKIIVRQGERIPADGVVDEGEGVIDESAMTGESMPTSKGPGDVVLAGTILLRGYLIVRVTRSGKYTMLSQIARLVRLAQSSRLPVQDITDRISGLFTWVVIAVGLATFIGWLTVGSSISDALVRMATVFVVACPCALGLATPISVVVGVNRAAEEGILIRKPEALDRILGVKVVAFDKTGTLTLGKPRLTRYVGDREALMLAASAESRSEHPLASAVLERAKEEGIPVISPVSFESLPNAGVVAMINGKSVAVGNERVVRGMGIEIPGSIEDEVARMRNEGYTVIFVVVDNEVRGIMGFMDEPREEARLVVSRLREKGIRTVMVTGDNEATAMAIAQRLGIDEVYANASPEDKAEIIKSLRERYGPVAMVGDGVNDAPALSIADVGIAMGGGTDMTKEAGDVILLRNDLSQVLKLLEIARKVMNNVKLNLTYVFAYNVALIPMATGALPIMLRPEIAALAMGLSSVSVTLNALRLVKG